MDCFQTFFFLDLPRLAIIYNNVGIMGARDTGLYAYRRPQLKVFSRYDRFSHLVDFFSFQRLLTNFPFWEQTLIPSLYRKHPSSYLFCMPPTLVFFHLPPFYPLRGLVLFTSVFSPRFFVRNHTRFNDPQPKVFQLACIGPPCFDISCVCCILRADGPVAPRHRPCQNGITLTTRFPFFSFNWDFCWLALRRPRARKFAGLPVRLIPQTFPPSKGTLIRWCFIAGKDQERPARPKPFYFHFCLPAFFLYWLFYVVFLPRSFFCPRAPETW